MADNPGDKASNHSTDGRRLTPEEVAICRKITEYQKPHGQRAQALLALDDGYSQAQAAGQAALTPGQVRYWSDKFDKQRLDIFPRELVLEARLATGIAVSQETLEKAGASKPPVEEPSPVPSELLLEPVETAVVIHADEKDDSVPAKEVKPKDKKGGEKKKKKKVKKDKKLNRKKGANKGKKKKKKTAGKNGNKSQKKKKKKKNRQNKSKK